jgi:hypothetical protein
LGRHAGNDRVRDRQVCRRESGRPVGRTAQLLDGHGRRGRLYSTLHDGWFNSGLYTHLVRKPLDPVARLARNDQDHIALVFVRALRDGDGCHQLELSVRRRTCSCVHGAADCRWARVAGRIWNRSVRAGSLVGHQLGRDPRVARGSWPPGARDQSR